MKLSEVAKQVLWVLSLFAVILVFGSRIDAIVSGNSTAFDTGLLTVATALVFLPFVSEFSFMGLTIKQKLEANRRAIQQDIRELSVALRSELHNLISVSSGQNVTVNTPPSDSLLESLSEDIKSSLAELNREGIESGEKVLDPSSLPEGVLTAFAGRYEIESQLRRIWEDVFQKPVPKIGLVRLLNDLLRQGAIPSSIAQSVREVSSVATPAIHGEFLSEEQEEFLIDVLPPLIGALESIDPRD